MLNYKGSTVNVCQSKFCIHAYIIFMCLLLHSEVFIMYVRTYVRNCSETCIRTYNDHSRDQVIVVSIDRWFLCRGAIVLFRWFQDYSLQWSLQTGGPSMLVVSIQVSLYASNVAIWRFPLCTYVCTYICTACTYLCM